MFGLFPALHSTRPEPRVHAQEPGWPTLRRTRAAVIPTHARDSAKSCCPWRLLGAAGLFTKSLMNVSKVDLGIQADHVVTFSIGPRRNGYTPERAKQLFERIEDELAALPGVVSAAGARVPLLAGSNSSNSLTVQGFEAGADTNTTSNYNEISPAYFRTIGVPLLAGRDFTRTDALTAPKVAIVNEAFTPEVQSRPRRRRQAHGAEREGMPPLDIEIIGVVRDAKYSEVKRRRSRRSSSSPTGRTIRSARWRSTHEPPGTPTSSLARFRRSWRGSIPTCP